MYDSIDTSDSSKFRVVDLGTTVEAARAEGLAGCATLVAEGPAAEGSHIGSPRSLGPPSGDDVAKEEQCDAEGGSALANTPA